MTLPNNFHAIDRKILKFFHETHGNRSQIFVQKKEQTVFQGQFNTTIPHKMAVTNINDLSFDWSNFNIFEFDEGEGTKKIYKAWEVNVQGLRFEQLSALRHNFLIRFGAGEPLLLSNIATDTTISSVKQISTLILENDNTNSYIVYYGLYIQDSSILEEIDTYGMQVKLQLTLFNPTYYN